MTSANELVPHLPHLLGGLQVTLQVFAGSALLAAVSALVAGLARTSADRVVRWTAGGYVEAFRGTSALVQLFWAYFALPLLFGIHLDAMLVGILVLGLNAGAYGAEIVRGAVQAVPAGQREAAVALNLTAWQRLRHVVLPQAGLAMLPPVGNLSIELLKSTALVSMITVTDVTRAGLEIRDNTLRTTEILSLLLLTYLALALLLTGAVRALEARLARGRERGDVR